MGNPNAGISPQTNRAAFLNVKAFALQPMNTPGNAARNIAWGPRRLTSTAALRSAFQPVKGDPSIFGWNSLT
jgi:hypothetical protein